MLETSIYLCRVVLVRCMHQDEDAAAAAAAATTTATATTAARGATLMHGTPKPDQLHQWPEGARRVKVSEMKTKKIIMVLVRVKSL